jgi:hypothetical protein
MAYQVSIEKTGLESRGEYTYQIHKENNVVAHYWYNLRDNQHGISLHTGAYEIWSLTNAKEILEGGGELPLRLTGFAIAYLNSRLGFST